MKLKGFIAIQLTIILAMSIIPVCVNAATIGGNISAPAAAIAIAPAPDVSYSDQQTLDKQIKNRGLSSYNNSKDGSSIINNRTPVNFSSSGSIRNTHRFYPKRKGIILITKDPYGSLPTGHAAIVFSAKYVIESLDIGVVYGDNKWYESKTSCAAGSCHATSAKQDAKAADWCDKQVGKPYNYNLFNINTRSRFYCSQLVWATFKDNFNINLNTIAFMIPFRGNPVHPVELLCTSNTYTSYINNW